MEIMTKTDGIIFGVVFCLMVLDFLRGTIGALAAGDWNSKTMRQGLLHKCSLLLCVVLGVVLNFGQQYLDLGISIPAYQSICVYIALMETGSIIENICRANPDIVPEKLKSVLGLSGKEASHERTDSN